MNHLKPSQDPSLYNRLVRAGAIAGLSGLAIAGCSSAGPEESLPMPTVTYIYTEPPRETVVTVDTAGHSLNVQAAAFQAALGSQEELEWNEKSETTGGSGEYGIMPYYWNDFGGISEAYLAPPEVQYEKVSEVIDHLYDKYKTWGNVAIWWYAGAFVVDRINGGYYGPKLTAFENDVLDRMNTYLADPTQIPAVPNVPLEVYNPELANLEE